ncbi:MAG: hypothetical protein ACUVXJ_14090 [Phycisphaerae bacterium]
MEDEHIRLIYIIIGTEVGLLAIRHCLHDTPATEAGLHMTKILLIHVAIPVTVAGNGGCASDCIN